MYINPLQAIREDWIKFPEWMDEEMKLKCIQPNAIDITLDRAFKLSNVESFTFSETTKVMRTPIEVPTVNNYLTIDVGSTDILSDFFVNIPAGVAAFLIVRSTLNRNGLFVTSGLYDSGFNNLIGFAIQNNGHPAYIAPHTRVAQIVFVKSEDSGVLYTGGYNNNPGQHWSNN